MNAIKLNRQLSVLCFIVVVFCSACKKDKTRVYDLLPPDPENVTAQGVLSVSADNTGGSTAN